MHSQHTISLKFIPFILVLKLDSLKTISLFNFLKYMHNRVLKHYKIIRC